MDTRAKILTQAQAEKAARSCRTRAAPLQVVTGYFDPLLAAHARRLAEIARPGAALMVVVTDPPQPLLPAQARAELVAALGVVDYVVLPGTSLPELLGRLAADEVLSEEAADERRTEELIRHVRSRQQFG